jgi:hypothetical protein
VLTNTPFPEHHPETEIDQRRAVPDDDDVAFFLSLFFFVPDIWTLLLLKDQEGDHTKVPQEAAGTVSRRFCRNPVTPDVY